MKLKLAVLTALITGVYFSVKAQTVNKDVKFIQINLQLDSTVKILQESNEELLGEAPLKLERKKLNGNILVVRPKGYAERKVFLAPRIPLNVNLKPVQSAKIKTFSRLEVLRENSWAEENIYFYPELRNEDDAAGLRSIFVMEHENTIPHGQVIGESEAREFKMADENAAFDPVFGTNKSFRIGFSAPLSYYGLNIKNAPGQDLPVALRAAQYKKNVTLKPVIGNFAFKIKTFPLKGDEVVIKALYNLKMKYEIGDGTEKFEIEIINEGLVHTNDPRDIFNAAIFENGSLLAMEKIFLDFITSHNKKLHTDFLKQPILLKTKTNAFVDNKELIKACMQSVVTVKADDRSHGSGFLVNEEGLIVTNFHVVDEATAVSVTIGKDTTSIPAKVLRYDDDFDLALIKIEKQHLPFLLMDTNADKEVGDAVMAIGTPASLSLGQTVSKGIISGKRNYDDKTYIQTDVSINPGNSGGPLINEKGQVIGVVSRKIAGNGYEGLGFAIPVQKVFSCLNLMY